MAALSEKQLELLQSGKNFGVVATIGDDGRPQTTVVWVDTDGERVVVNTKPPRARGRNLVTAPRPSIAVWDNEAPYKSFEVDGTAELDEEGAAEHINEL